MDSWCFKRGCWEYLELRQRKQENDGGKFIMSGFIICTLHQISLERQIKENEMCSTHDRDVKYAQISGLKMSLEKISLKT
jgi:hypothetical protein